MEYLNFSPRNLHRRVFIRGVGLVSLAVLLGTCGGCEELAESIRNRPTRRRLRTGSTDVDDDIATYKEAVRLMKKLSVDSPTDPRGWDQQAAIHGTASGGFNFCEHGTDHFFSWHRAYLFYFEKICQELTGDPTFGLPYWNWNQNPDIHSEFLITTSPLYSARSRTTMSGQSAISTDELDPIFDDTNFFTFSDQIEGTPHNTTHGRIGGAFGTSASATDPIFWMHHCMVDYCWAKWNIELERDNTSDSGWNGTSWGHFVDADGNPTTITAGATTIMPLLSYQYESSAIGNNAAEAAIKSKSEFRKVEKRIKDGADIKFDIKRRISIQDTIALRIPQPFSKSMQEIPNDFLRIIDNDERETVFVNVEYADLPPTSDFYVRVFINKPDANAGTPNTDPHYAGSFAFFGTSTPGSTTGAGGHGGHGKHKPQFLVNIIPTLQRLKASGELKEGQPASIQLVAVPYAEQFAKMDAQLVLNKVELIVTPVILPSRKD